ncbi:MAG: ABC transporter permease [Lachnospiraceae bacterium]|nr:ABC transporter permease [Lachnospiraceae bacterium]
MCLKLAVQNLTRKKGHALHMLLGFGVIFAVLLSWTQLGLALASSQDNILLGRRSMCMLEAEIDLQQEALAERAYQMVSEKIEEKVTRTAFGKIDWVRYLEKEDDWSFVNISHIYLKVGDDIRQGTDDHSWRYGLSDPFDTALKSKSIPFLTGIMRYPGLIGENELDEYRYHFPRSFSEGGLVCGREPVSDGEMLISDHYLRAFGYAPEDFEGLLGQKLVFMCDEQEILSGYTLIGIVDGNLFYAESLREVPQILVFGGPTMFRQYNVATLCYRFGIPEYKTLATAGRAADSIEGIQLNYRKDYFTQALTLSQASALVRIVFSMFGTPVLLAMLFHLLLMLWTNLAERKRISGMYLICGMRVSDIIKISLWELLITAGIAMLMGLVLSVGSLAVLASALKKSDGIQLLILPGRMLMTAACVALTVYAIFALLMVVYFLSMKKASLHTVLVSNE